MPHLTGNDRYDLLILGSGSAAFAAAIKASELGARVAMTEHRVIGGTCVNVGCIPSKNLIHAAEIYYAPAHTAYQGLGRRSGKLDFAALIRQKDRLVETLRRKKYIDIAEGDENITILKGHARFISKHQLQVGDRVVEAPKFLIATGSRACIPEFPGMDQVTYLTSTEAFELKSLPKSMVIIGGGVIALELGQMFHRFGTKVTILLRGAHVLSEFDPEVAESIQKVLIEEGVGIYTHAVVNQLARTPRGISVVATVEGKPRRLVVERLLVACGRVPNSRDIGLEEAGVEVDEKGFVTVNSEMQTTADHIWAAGDVTGPPLATPVGAREGVVAAQNMLKGNHVTMDYTVIPRAVFTDPEVAAVGLSAAEARAKGMQVEADCLDLAHVPKAAAIYQTKGLVKMVIEKDTKRIVGVQLVANRGADLIHEAALAVKCRLTIDDLIGTIHVYPTMSEAIRMAAQIFTKDVSKLSCCAE
ncbi:MAG: mercury(II) reductase [Nitrospirae bacterium]|nr:mercury(II) reductase [Nitrospirota bacterium]